MPELATLLPSWRPGPTRDVLEGYLDAVTEVPGERRVARLDNDGTLWCERPSYVQLDFFLDVLRQAVDRDPGVAKLAEFAALLSGDRAAIADLGLARVAMALAGLCAGPSPEEFTARVREFLGRARHATLDRPILTTVYQPMLAHGRQELVAVTEVVLAELSRGVAERLQGRGDRGVLGGDPDVGTRQTDLRQAGAVGVLAHDEGRAPRRTVLLAVVVGELHALLGDPVDVGGPVAHHPVAVAAEVALMSSPQMTRMLGRSAMTFSWLRIACASLEPRSGPVGEPHPGRVTLTGAS
jgi:hypothetical protein